MPPASWANRPNFGSGVAGSLIFCLNGPAGSPRKRDFDFLAELAAGRHDGHRPRERADVQPVLAGAVAAVGALAHLDDVGAVGGDDDRRSGVLAEHRASSQVGQLESLAVQDGDVRVEQRAAEAHALDLGGQALALLALDGEVIHVLVIDDALDGDVERDLLRGGEVAVRLLLVHDRQRADAEGAQLRDAGGGADADGVFAEPAVRRRS